MVSWLRGEPTDSLEQGHLLINRNSKANVSSWPQNHICLASTFAFTAHLHGGLMGTNPAWLVASHPEYIEWPSSTNTPLLTAYKEPRTALDADRWQRPSSEGAHKTEGDYNKWVESASYSDSLRVLDEGRSSYFWHMIWEADTSKVLLSAQSKLSLSRESKEKLKLRR